MLGVKNGIESEREIVEFIQHLGEAVPNGHILISPARNRREFYCLGQRYLATINRENIQSIPGLETYHIKEDRQWFRTQGLAILRSVL